MDLSRRIFYGLLKTSYSRITGRRGRLLHQVVQLCLQCRQALKIEVRPFLNVAGQNTKDTALLRLSAEHVELERSQVRGLLQIPVRGGDLANLLGVVQLLDGLQNFGKPLLRRVNLLKLPVKVSQGVTILVGPLELEKINVSSRSRYCVSIGCTSAIKRLAKVLYILLTDTGQVFVVRVFRLLNRVLSLLARCQVHAIDASLGHSGFDFELQCLCRSLLQLLQHLRGRDQVRLVLRLKVVRELLICAIEVLDLLPKRGDRGPYGIR